MTKEITVHLDSGNTASIVGASVSADSGPLVVFDESDNVIAEFARGRWDWYTIAAWDRSPAGDVVS